VLDRVKVSEAGTSISAWRVALSMRKSRSHAQRSSRWALQVHCGSGERQAATTRPSWASFSGARRGDVSDADEVVYLDYLGSLDARETILDSILSRSSRAVTMLFGRLEAAGAPRLADGAVVARRWLEWLASRCAESGPTHCICACSLHADVTTFVSRGSSFAPCLDSSEARLRAF
jgi:hypothetical protein